MVEIDKNLLVNLESVFNGLREIYDKNIVFRLEQIKDFINRIRPLLEEYKRLEEEYNRDNAPEFNIFSLLKINTYENFHSDLISELLNPLGSHGQGNLFISSFLDMVKRKGGRIPEDTSKIISVRREMPVESGRIDIHIEFYRREFALIIENKVFAGEGKEQIERYYKSEEKRFGDDNILLVYLTPKGREPLSINEKLKEELISKGTIVCLSYRDISEWISGLIGSVKPVHLVGTLKMYVDITKSL